MRFDSALAARVVCVGAAQGAVKGILKVLGLSELLVDEVLEVVVPFEGTHEILVFVPGRFVF